MRCLVLELAEVHELADRRAGRRRDLDQVEVRLLGQPQRVLHADDADLLAVGADQPHLGDADPLVDAGLADVVLLRSSWRPSERERLPSPARRGASDPTVSRPGGARRRERLAPAGDGWDRPRPEPVGHSAGAGAAGGRDSTCAPHPSAGSRSVDLQGYQHDRGVLEPHRLPGGPHRRAVGRRECPADLLAARDIADVPAVEVITTAAAVHLMSAAAVKCGLAEDTRAARTSTRPASSSPRSPGWSPPPRRRSATSTPRPLRDGLRRLQLAFREASARPRRARAGPRRAVDGRRLLGRSATTGRRRVPLLGLVSFAVPKRSQARRSRRFRLAKLHGYEQGSQLTPAAAALGSTVGAVLSASASSTRT